MAGRIFSPNCSVVNEAMLPHSNDSETVVATVSTMFCLMLSFVLKNTCNVSGFGYYTERCV